MPMQVLAGMDVPFCGGEALVGDATIGSIDDPSSDVSSHEGWLVAGVEIDCCGFCHASGLFGLPMAALDVPQLRPLIGESRFSLHYPDRPVAPLPEPPRAPA